MKNLKAKALTAGLTAAMVLSMSAPVWAAQTVDGVNAVSTDASAKIAKTLEMAANGVTNPGFTFQFDFTPVTAQTTTASTAGSTGYVLDITKTANSKDSQTITLSNTTSGTTANAIFNVSEFSEPGIYGYLVKENATAKVGEETFTGDANHVLTTDPTTYLVRIKVITNSRGQLEIAGISAQAATEATDDNGDTTITTTGNKIDGGTEEGGTKGTIPFTNRYTEYGNDDPTPNPDDPNSPTPGAVAKGLVISKNITGEGATQSDKFVYTIKFVKDSANKDANGSDLATTVSSITDAGTTVATLYSTQPTKGENGTYSGTEATSISYDTTYYFVLGDDDSIAFKVPAGTQYEVNETNGDYTASVTAVADSGDLTATVDGTKVTAYVGEKANTVAYTNSKTSNPLTGVVNNYGGLIAVVAVAAGGMLVLSFRRRREF